MSVLRWAGSKRCASNDLERIFSEGGPIETFWEPFGGSLSASLVALRAGAKRIVVADINKNLVNFYGALRDRTDELIDRLSLLRDDYYENREAYNSAEDGSMEKAALFFYLNRTSFNGLFRTNRRGDYNVPWGKRSFSFDPDELRTFSNVLRRIELSSMDYDRFFERFLESMGPGDLVYADPPYYATFSNYDSKAFSKSDHERLKARCDQARSRGARIVVSNSDDPFVIDLWTSPGKYEVHDFKNARLFNPHGKDRGTRNREILVTSCK